MRKQLLIGAGLVIIMATSVGCSSNEKPAIPNVNNDIFVNANTTENEADIDNVDSTTSLPSESQKETSSDAVIETTTSKVTPATFSNSTKYDQEIRYTITFNADKVIVASIALGTSMNSSDCVIKAGTTEFGEDDSFPYIGVTTGTPKEVCDNNADFYKRYKNFKITEFGEMVVHDKDAYYMVVEYDFEMSGKTVHSKILISAAAINDEKSVIIYGSSDYITKECDMSYKDFFEAAYIDIELHN